MRLRLLILREGGRRKGDREGLYADFVDGTDCLDLVILALENIMNDEVVANAINEFRETIRPIVKTLVEFFEEIKSAVNAFASYLVEHFMSSGIRFGISPRQLYRLLRSMGKPVPNELRRFVIADRFGGMGVTQLE